MARSTRARRNTLRPVALVSEARMRKSLCQCAESISTFSGLAQSAISNLGVAQSDVA